MYILKKTQNSQSLEISFDYFESDNVLGPFGDILSEYSKNSGVKPQEVDFLFNYSFLEDGRKIQFYWNGGFTVYVIFFGKSQFQMVYDRLTRICANLNKKLAEKRYSSKKNGYKNTSDRPR